MGLAASQARLLSITSRKSSAQFESMRLSHQKLALSRSLTDVSNDYQNALNKTKLYYDFYGNGSTDNILSYDLLMRPSAINEYSPVLITNQQNRVVLSSNLAAAARAAGIPQEGLDGYIDTHTRNKFIGTLSGLGEIDAPTASVIQQTEYNPKVGLGYTSDVYMVTESDNYEVFEKRLQRTQLSKYAGLSANDLKTPTDTTSTGIMASVLTTQGTSLYSPLIADNQIERLTDTQEFKFCQNGTSFGESLLKWNDLSLYDILYGNEDIILTQNVQRGVDATDALDPNQYDDMINVVKTVIDLLADELEQTYGLDESVMMAINQAYVNMDAAAWGNGDSPKLAVSTLGAADYRTDIETGSHTLNWRGLGYAVAGDGDPVWCDEDDERQNFCTVLGFMGDPSSYTGNDDDETEVGSFTSDIAAGNLYLNYKDDGILLHLPCYSEWQNCGNNKRGFGFYNTAEDNPYSSVSGQQDYCYEPGNIWVSLPNGVESGKNMKYIVPISDGSHVYWTGDASAIAYAFVQEPTPHLAEVIITLDTADCNDLDWDDIDPWEYYGLDMTQQEFKQYCEEVLGLEDVDHIEGHGVNIARRNAMVNAIDGAANNLALFNLYDCTSDHSEASDDRDNNKNFGGNYGSINLSAFVQAWYTYFMQSIAMTKQNDPEATNEEKDAASQILNGSGAAKVRFHSQNANSKLISDSSFNLYRDAFTFEKAQVMVEDGIAEIASFYDTIINQICEYGWTENNQVKEDTGYLQEMLQSGKMFLFKLANDNYYYQKGYSTDTYIKEIADETAIAEAEAKYKTQKARINAKEEEIDVKMRNLDTEISSLESEYEAVKKMISNNVQKSFTRYQS